MPYDGVTCHGAVLFVDLSTSLDQIHFGMGIAFNSIPRIVLFCLLLLSGNIVLNPGPLKYQCAVCNLAVKANQWALLCDQCGL